MAELHVACGKLGPHDQLVFYFSGHGEVRGDEFGLLFGDTHFFPVSNLVTTLGAAHEIRRAILIIDACYSGHAKRNVKSAKQLPFLDNQQLPLGFALLTSCSDIQLSRENPITKVSYYTEAFCNSVETGLNGEHPRHRPYITVAEIQGHISRRLKSHPDTSQSPEVLIRGDSEIWISKNSTFNEAALVLPCPSPDARPNLLSDVVLVADIADFSLQSPASHRKLTASMWKFLEISGYKKWTDMNSEPRSGGAVVVFGDNSTNYLQILTTAVEWIKYMRQSIPPVELRIGLHSGNTFREDNPIHSYKQLVGKVINECEGIAAMADPGQILVSEKFFGEVVDAESETNVRVAFIPDEADSYEVFVKPEVPLQIRAYNWDLKQKPSSFAFMYCLRDRIMSHLAAIEFEFVKFCLWCNAELTRARLSTRVSIFAPESVKATALPKGTQAIPDSLGRVRVLGSSRYRYHAFDPTCRKPGVTKYGISGFGQGTLGQAFVSREAKVITGLPDYQKNPLTYSKILESKFDVPASTIKFFFRHARAFVAIPMGLSENASDIVICLDVLGDDLSQIPDEFLTYFADGVRSQHNESLAALWQLRLI